MTRLSSKAGGQDFADKMSKSGGAFTGALRLFGPPSLALHAATKQYVDDSIPAIEVVTSLPASPTPNTLYLIAV